MLQREITDVFGVLTFTGDRGDDQHARAGSVGDTAAVPPEHDGRRDKVEQIRLLQAGDCSGKAHECNRP